ncbi:MAG: hypothetical protein ABI780_06440 [Ardenticatenales bacterium]
MSDEPRVRPRTGSRESQRAMARALIGGSLAFITAMFLVVWAVLVPHGEYAPQRFVPVLTSAVRRASQGDAIALHGLYSHAGLDAVTLDDLETWLGQTDAFNGANGVVIRSVERQPGLDAVAPLAAIVVADIAYADPSATRALTATMDYEEDEWRIRSLNIVPLDETP